MGSGSFLVLMMSAGGVLLVSAAVLWLLQLAGERRDWVAMRYSGDLADGALPREAAKRQQLVVAAERGGLLRFLTGISPEAFKAFRADQPRHLGYALVVAVPLLLLGIVRLLGIGLGWAALATALLLALGLFMAVRLHSRRRIARIEGRLAEALDVVSRCLRIGMPVSTALRVVAQDLSGPIAQEFTVVADQVSYGKDMVEALREMAQRCQSASLSFFAAAVAVQMETGGNLVEVIERLANLSRTRTQLQRKITAMTAEAKWSGRFLSAFPIAAAAAIGLLKPDYFAAVWDKPFLVPLAAIIVALLLINIVFMQRLVRFE